MPKERIILIKVWLDETYNNIHVGKYLSDTYSIQQDLKHGDALWALLLNVVLEYAIKKVQEN
jgi:hypothetical protein